jgi:hypothetical protein
MSLASFALLLLALPCHCSRLAARSCVCMCSEALQCCRCVDLFEVLEARLP